MSNHVGQEPRLVTPVGQSLQHLTSINEQLAEAVSELRSRLSPVLACKDQPSVARSDKPPAERPKGTCEIAIAVESEINRNVLTLADINELLVQLEV